MAYDADLASTHNPSVGGFPAAAWGDKINDNFAAIGGAWTSFTPTWSADSSNPAIGNGSISGAYVLLGKLLIARYYLIMGSTTTFGSGAYSWSLPAGVTSVAVPQTGTAYAVDAGTGYREGVLKIDASQTSLRVISGGTTEWSPTVPITWANGDVMVFSLTIQVA